MPHTSPARRPVAPHERAPERRRRELLESALIEFSTKGFGGARMDQIVARTNSNKAMLYHYFGNKEGLYVAVLEDVYAGIRSKEAEIDFDGLAPPDAIRRLVEFTFDYYVNNPAFVRIINNENLHEAAFLKRSTSIAALNTSIIVKLGRILQRGAESGDFRKGIDPTDLYFSITGLGYIYVSNRHTLGIVFKRDLFRPAMLEARRRSIVDMVLRYVAADTDETEPGDTSKTGTHLTADLGSGNRVRRSCRSGPE